MMTTTAPTLNTWIGQGRITADPEDDRTGSAIKFALAIHRPTSGKVDFVKVFVFDDLRAKAVGLKQGHTVKIKGRVESWKSATGIHQVAIRAEEITT